MPKKPITKTTTPTMSGIGETRLFSTAWNGTAPNHRCGNRFRALVLLEIRVAVHRHALGILKRIQVRRHVDIQEFPVDKQETLRVRQARELRKIVRLNFRQSLGANFRHPRGFIEREISRQSCLLKFFTEPLYCHERKAG